MRPGRRIAGVRLATAPSAARAAAFGRARPASAGTARRGRRCRLCGCGLRAQVGGLDGGIGLDRGRVAGGDDLAVVEDGDLGTDRMTRLMSCSTSSTAMPVGGQLASTTPRRRLVLVEPEAGSSSRRTGARWPGPGPAPPDGPARWAAGRSARRRYRTARPGPGDSRRWPTAWPLPAAGGGGSPPPSGRSRGPSGCPNSSRRWKVRAMPGGPGGGGEAE